MLTRTITISVDPGTKEEAWLRVVDAVSNAEANGLTDAILRALDLPPDLEDLVTVQVSW